MAAGSTSPRIGRKYFVNALGREFSTKKAVDIYHVILISSKVRARFEHRTCFTLFLVIYVGMRVAHWMAHLAYRQ